MTDQLYNQRQAILAFAFRYAGIESDKNPTAKSLYLGMAGNRERGETFVLGMSCYEL